jgi:hypothetical protein
VDANERRYFKEFLPAMLAYAVVMIISVWLIKHQVHPELKIPFALLPMIPALFAMWAAIRYFRGLDEALSPAA